MKYKQKLFVHVITEIIAVLSSHLKVK